MRLKSITLRNFRGFDRFELVLDPEVTVLVGVNGAGKTSLLDAISLMLACLANGVRTGQAGGVELSPNDVRLGASTAALELTAAFYGADRTWKVGRTLPGHPQADGDELSELEAPIREAQQSIAAAAPQIPLAVYFPTNRNALDIPARIRTPHEFDAISAYDGALEGGTSNFRGFFEWFRQEEDLYNEQLVLGEEVQQSGLPHVRRAIETLFPGASDLRIERRPQRMTLLLNGTRLDIAQLSDGEKTLVATVGDLARRKVLAAPAEPDPLGYPSVVLIDELELHLHPGLQRTFIPRLRQVFQNTQFVVSTHSPQVLSSVRASNVRLIEQFQLRELGGGTWRRDTNRILEAAFDDPGRPREVAVKLNALRDAVDADRRQEARGLIAALREMVEGEDPEVFFLEQLLPPKEEDAEGAS